MKTILAVNIEDEITVCPYCMDQVSRSKLGCCGESSDHFEKAFVLTDGELYLESEVEVDNHEFESLIGV